MIVELPGWTVGPLKAKAENAAKTNANKGNLLIKVFISMDPFLTDQKGTNRLFSFFTKEMVEAYFFKGFSAIPFLVARC
jgi:hypothetical protein